MFKPGDWVLYRVRSNDDAEVLAVVDKIHGQAAHLSQIIEGESHPLAVVGVQKIRSAPLHPEESDPFLIDLALSTRDKKWFKTLRGTK